jgi:YggT family protein
MQTLLIPFLKVLWEILRLYSWVVIIWVIMTWLVQFNVINSRNEIVRVIGTTLNQLVDPVLRRIRRFLPMVGALDLSPIALLLLIWLIQMLLEQFMFLLAR